NIGFAIEVDPQRGPHLEPLREAAEQAVAAVPGVLSVTAVLTGQREASSPQTAGSAAEPKPSPAQQPAEGPDPRRALVGGVRQIVAVASGKGGVGQSTAAVNFALGLASLGLRAGMLDADIYGPSQPRMMGIGGRPTSTDGKILKPLENYGVKCMSMGFLVAEDTPMIWRGPMVQSALS